MQEAEVNGMKTTSNLPAKTDEVQKLPALEVEMYKMEVQAEHVRKYFAPADATTADIGFFIAMANSLGLNPWKRELHLVPFYSREGGRKYAAVVGYEVYLNRAEASGKLDGWEHKFDDDRNPTKCTVTVHRKDWSHSFSHTVYMDEVMRHTKSGKPMAMWEKDPKHMLLVRTITRTFRLCMPEACGSLPYTPGEQAMIDHDERQYHEPQVQLSQAAVTSAQVEPDIDYLRGQYFLLGKAVWADEDARHKWNVDHGFPESTKGWLPIYWEKAVDILDPDVELEPADYYDEKSGRMTFSEEELRLMHEEEEARLNAEVGADDGTVPTEDSAEQPSTPEDGSEIEMESPDAIQGEIDAKLKRIQELLPTAITDIESKEFRTWAWGILDAGADEADKLKGTPISKLSMGDLTVLIIEMETRENTDADKAAEANGELDPGGA